MKDLIFLVHSFENA